ncbi:MAG: hypothetical protein U1B30_08630 [Pseudomonadota bacterium]|nr:hypothetical protein [Pseudomonadota bacterium]
MSVTVKFSQQGKTIELSAKEIHDLQQALTFIANGGTRIAEKIFGSVHVKTDGSNHAFSQKHGEEAHQTDC